MPGLPLMVILASWLPPTPGTLLGVLVLTGWAWNARIIRSQMMTFRNRDFVSAAIISGESNIRIIVVEIMPRMLSLLASAFIGASIYAIGAQVGLEFLGLGISVFYMGNKSNWASNDLALPQNLGGHLCLRPKYCDRFCPYISYGQYPTLGLFQNAYGVTRFQKS